MAVKEKIDIAEYSPSLKRLRNAQRGTRDLYQVSNNPFTEKELTATPALQAPKDPVKTGALATPGQAPEELEGQQGDQIEHNDHPKTTDWEKRYGDARTFINDLQNELADTRKQLDEASRKPLNLPVSEEEIELWRKTNPQTFDMLVSIIRKESKDMETQLDKARKELETVKTRSASEQLFVEILKVHSDAGEIRGSDQFRDWFKDQTKAVKNLIESSVAADVCRGIKLYKEDTGIMEPKKTTSSKTSDAAEAVTVKGTPSVPKDSQTRIWGNSEIAKLTPEQYSKHRDDIKRARAEGRFDPRA